MTTQLLEYGYTTGQTMTAQLFAIGSDAVVQTASAVVEATNRKGRYLATFTSVPAGRYLMVYSIGGIGVGSEIYSLTLTAATFQPESESSFSEIGKIPRAASVIPAGQYRLEIEGGQAANVTPSEVE